jgi:hypothetical protein
MRRLLLCLLVLVAAAPAGALAAGPAGALAAGPPPTATTGSATAIKASTAAVRATIDPNGADTRYRFEYGTGDGPDYELVTADATRDAADGTGTVQATLTGLKPDTTYRYRVVAWHDDDPGTQAVGSERTFTTIALPVVRTGAVRNTTAESATLLGRVDPNRSPTRWWFEYGPTRAYGLRTPDTEPVRGSYGHSVSAVIAGLAPGQVYHFRLVAENDAGVTLGGDRPFRTLRAPNGITITSPLRRVPFGSVTKVSGRVEGGGVGRIRVALEAQPFPFTAPFSQSGDVVTTKTDGSFTVPSPPLWISTRLRVVTRSTLVATSPTIAAFTRLLVSAGVTTLDRRRARIAGSVTPAMAGARVSVQRRGTGGRWTLAKRTKAIRLGGGRVGYRITMLRAPKVRRFRVVVKPRSAAYAAGTSRTVAVPKRARHKQRR